MGVDNRTPDCCVNRSQYEQPLTSGDFNPHSSQGSTIASVEADRSFLQQKSIPFLFTFAEPLS